MSGVTSRSIMASSVAGVAFIVGLVIVADALIAASRVESDAVRVVGGCETVVALEAAGVYRVSVELSGPAVDVSTSCIDVAAGERVGVVEQVTLVAPNGSEATLVAGSDGALTDGPGWTRQRLGSVRVDAPGEFVVIPKGPLVAGAVVSLGVDPGSIRNGGLTVAAILIGVAVLVAAIGLRPRRGPKIPSGQGRPVIPVNAPAGANMWAPPDPADRRG